MQLATAMILVCLSFSASSCSDDATDQEGFAMGEITGLIKDVYEQPLSGVTVSISDTELTATTNSEGVYTLQNVPIGKHVITYSRQDYQTISVTVTEKSFNSDKLATVNANMEYAAAKITGIIKDAKNNNNPLAGVKVSISDTQSVITGSDGKFVIENLPLDAYTIKFEKEGYASIERIAGIDEFVDGVFSIEVVMGGRQILRDKTIDDLNNSDYWYYNEYRGGGNAVNYPHWDWACDYMASLDFVGSWEEQNEGTTIQIRNNDAERSNPADLNVFDSYVYGRKLITKDNCILTLQCRTHSTSADAPTIFGVQVIDLSASEPEAVKVGDNRSLDNTSDNYSNIDFDLSSYIGKEVVIAVGTYRAKTGDYWKQFVIRRMAFATKKVEDWGWLPGTAINDELSDWHLTQEMVRSTMPQNKTSFTGITKCEGDLGKDNRQNAYQSWRQNAHIGAEWSFVPRAKDPEVFPSEGYLIKTRGNAAVDTKAPEAYFYAKFSIKAGCNKLVFRTRNFSSQNYTYFKFTAIDNNMNVVHLQPTKVSADKAAAAADGCYKFIHENGGAGNPEGYATFEYDLSQFNGKDIVLALGVYKGDSNGDENKLVIYSINLN